MSGLSTLSTVPSGKLRSEVLAIKTLSMSEKSNVSIANLSNSSVFSTEELSPCSTPT